MPKPGAGETAIHVGKATKGSILGPLYLASEVAAQARIDRVTLRKWTKRGYVAAVRPIDKDTGQAQGAWGVYTRREMFVAVVLAVLRREAGVPLRRAAALLPKIRAATNLLQSRTGLPHTDMSVLIFPSIKLVIALTGDVALAANDAHTSSQKRILIKFRHILPLLAVPSDQGGWGGRISEGEV